VKNKPRHIVFISSNLTWGGSEDLWSEAAIMLANAGHRVTAYKNAFPRGEGSTARLNEAGCRLIALAKIPFFPARAYYFIIALNYLVNFGFQTLHLYVSLKLRRRPDLVVVSQGGNHDGWLFANVCIRLGLPFVLISQKATDLYWPLDSRRERMRSALLEARHCFFVSNHNLKLTEEQFAVRLDHASIVRNPFKVPWEYRGEWPGTDLGFRFACIGRLYPMEKGQDLLIRVLAREKWRRRPVSLTFYGVGVQSTGLAEMAEQHSLDNVRFAGFTSDVEGVWANHHALILASRAEGLPLVLVEAMLCARVAIVTDVAGNSEVVEDNVTGFLAAAPTEDALDEAMERAWQRRSEWRTIGELASRSIRASVPADPAQSLADVLVGIADGEPRRHGLSAAEAGPTPVDAVQVG
jgi:glycosyltransferase involved in cell wall biosynthesis